jgi:RNA polymerase sigma-70 factor (ECF subfamily)
VDGGSMSSVGWTPERLHARFASKIARHVRAVLGSDDEQEDLIQNVLITVFLGIDRLREPRALDQWVAQITRSELRNLFRRRRMRRLDSLDALPEHDDPSFQLDVDARDLAARVMRVMERLPPNDHALLATFWFERSTVPAMAAAAGCTVITMRRKLLKARERFSRLARRDPTIAAYLDGSSAWSPSSDLDESS